MGSIGPSVLQHHRHREELEITQIRHVIYRDPATKKLFHFVSSDLKCPAEVIAAIYKRRWGVELLFRWLKGHLDIRRLPVKNSNAVKIQLAVAVLVQLLLQLKKLTTGFPGSLWQLLRKIRSSVIRQILADSGEADGCRWNAVPTRPR
jgi:putative transposase